MSITHTEVVRLTYKCVQMTWMMEQLISTNLNRISLVHLRVTSDHLFLSVLDQWHLQFQSWLSPYSDSYIGKFLLHVSKMWQYTYCTSVCPSIWCQYYVHNGCICCQTSLPPGSFLSHCHYKIPRVTHSVGVLNIQYNCAFSTKTAFHLGNGTRWSWLLWITNRNSHVPNQSLSVLMTLSDPKKQDMKGPIIPIFTVDVCINACIVWQQQANRHATTCKGRTCFRESTTNHNPRQPQHSQFLRHPT